MGRLEMKKIALLIEVEVSDSEDAMFRPREIGEQALGQWTDEVNDFPARLVTAWRSGDPIPDPVKDAIEATGAPS